MDRTSRIGIGICLVLLITLEFTLDRLYPTPPPKPHAAPSVALGGTNSPSATSPGTPVTPISSPPVTPPTAPLVEKISVLENDAIKVTFTSVGAAIKQVELKQHKADETTNVTLNKESHSSIMALSGWPGADTAAFDVQENPPGALSYTCTLPDGLKWQRTYAFSPEHETEAGMSGQLRVFFRKVARHLGLAEGQHTVYTLDVTDILTNPTGADVTAPAYSLSVGRAEPLLVNGHYQPGPYMYPGSGWLADKFHLTTVSDFNPGFIPIVGIKTRDGKDMFSSLALDPKPLRWIGVENQFFTVLLTPAVDGSISHATFQCFNQRDESGAVVLKKDAQGYYLPSSVPDIEASAFFPEVKVPAGQAVTLAYGLYAGPKDFNKLDAMGDDQGEIMYYGLFSVLIVPMLTILRFWYSIFNNYGVAIILLTLMIKAVTWPLVSISNRSGKQMQALAPKMKELQAKYKDQPEKITSETWALYRDYGVNPAKGCLPAFIQMPVFFSLYYMLLNAYELRGQPFIWVHDLTQPDTIASFPLPIPLFGISHLTVNPLPIMVTGLTMVMMRMTPQMGDPQQAKIAQWMPLVFLFIFYNFAAALSLYYVINNLVSILQIYRNLRKPLPELKRIPRKKKPGT